MAGPNRQLEEFLAAHSPEAQFSGVLGRMEKLFDSIGLMRQPWTPFARGAIGFGFGWLVIKAANPSFAYFEDGEPRPWAYGQGADPKEATMVPWWALPAFLGVVAGVFV